VESDLRYTLLDSKVGGTERTEPPDVIEFVERETVHPAEPWGHWVIDDTTGMEIQEHRLSPGMLFSSRNMLTTLISGILKISFSSSLRKVK
jgi:hypothetical protein